MKQELLKYIRTGELKHLVNSVQQGLTYDEFIAHTNKTVIEVSISNLQLYFEVCIKKDARWLYLTTPELLGDILCTFVYISIDTAKWESLLVKTFYKNRFIGQDDLNTIRQVEQLFEGLVQIGWANKEFIPVKITVIKQLLAKWDIKTEEDAHRMIRISNKYISYLERYQQFTTEHLDYIALKHKAEQWLNSTNIHINNNQLLADNENT